MRFTYSKSLFTVVLCVSVFQFLHAQDRALGTWKLHMPYGSSLGVLDAGDRVYSLAEKSIFSYEKSSGAIQIYDKATGLNDIGIKTANYDPETKALVVAYNNSNIDIIYNGTDVYNIPDIKNKVVTAAIAINGISFFNGNAYVSSDVGISVINLSKKEISNTYIIGSSGGQVKVHATSLDNSSIYAATDEGIKSVPLNSPNLQSFSSWHLYASAEGIPASSASYVTCYNQKTYAVIKGSGTAGDTLYELSNGIWSVKYVSINGSFTSLNVTGSTLYFTLWNTAHASGKNGKIDVAGVVTVNTAQHPRPLGWFESNVISWEAEQWGGLIKNNNGNLERIVPDGPVTSNVRDIEIANESVYIATGGADESWGPDFTYDGFFVYKNNKWASYLTSLPAILSVTAVPGSGKVYFGSFLYGVAEFNLSDQSIKIYNKDNKNISGYNNTLEPTQGDTATTRISAITSDKNGNIWMYNSGGTKPIKLLQPNGTWKEFSTPYAISVMKKMLIDQNGQLWGPVRKSGEGLLVWSYNGTIDDPSDDVAKILLPGDGAGGLPDPIVYCVAEDKEGNIWVGTNQGIAVFYCPGSVLTSSGCDGDQIKVERDGYIGYLFGTESVRSIAVDAANRKWIGTTSGLWLISDDGKKELLKFNIENSPLPANQITDIAIDGNTGEVFIGTVAGLVSYQGDAIADCSDCDDALVYPNPVKPDYDGPIAIKGLTDQAYVKITDVAGTLVYQGKANGSQMIWDGKGYSGNRAKSGVYLVFSSTGLGKEKRVAKILIAN